MKPLVVLVALVLGVMVALEAAAVGGAWWLHRQGRYDDEIAWLEGLQPLLVWDRGLDAQIGKLYRGRVRHRLLADRLDRAVIGMRAARARAHARGEKPDRELIALGIETYTRAADRMEARGRLAAAAAWDDSLFVLAVRAPEPQQRSAAISAFLESLDLRVRDGKPCRAVAQVEWAKRGLGGEIPGFQPSVEEDLRDRCRRSRRRG